jgi:hypothetical protein
MNENYCHARMGGATAIIMVLKKYPDQKIPEDFVAYKIGRFGNEITPYLEKLQEIGIVERENGYIWLKPEDLSKNLNPSSA